MPEVQETSPFVKKMLLALIGTILVQVGGWIYLIGSHDARITAMESLTQSIIGVNRSQTKLQRQNRDIMIEINANLGTLVKTVDRVVDLSQKVAMEQQRRTPIIEQAQKFMIDNNRPVRR